METIKNFVLLGGPTKLFEGQNPSENPPSIFYNVTTWELKLQMPQIETRNSQEKRKIDTYSTYDVDNHHPSLMMWIIIIFHMLR